MSIERTSVEMLLQPFFRKMQIRDKLGIEEQQALAAAADQRLDFTQGQDLVKEGDRPTRSMLVTHGFTCRYGVAPGGDRQITAIHLPGDFVDLHSFLIKQMDHSVATLSPCVVAYAPHEGLERITERLPHLTRVYWAATNIDASIQREWTMSLGRRSAIERMAHLFCELDVRLGIVGLVDNGRYDFPLTQAELSECLGLTPVHVNRTLQDLRSKKVIEVGDRQVRILDLAALRAIAQFDDDYLYLEKRDR